MSKILKTIFTLITIFAFATSAAAHSEQLSTDPVDGAVINQLPENFIITYNEDLIADGTYAVLVENDSATDLVASVISNQVFIAIPTTLTAGQYLVQYKTVAADGHPQEGEISFSFEPIAAVPISAAPEINEMPEVVIAQPELNQSSNINSLVGALALIALAGILLMRLRKRNKDIA